MCEKREINFCNIKFNILSKKDLFYTEKNETKCIATVNAQFIVLANTNERYMNYINNHYATFDGEVPLKQAKKKFKDAHIEKLPGSEIVYDFCLYAKEQGLKVFFLGGKEESNSKAVDVIRNQFEIDIEGYSPKFEEYPFSDFFTEICMSKIEEFHPHIVFVGFGAPKQEFFIEDNEERLRRCGVRYVIGSGGTFEFVSGRIKRAPRWIQKMGLEGMFRLLMEFNKERFNRIIYSCKFFKYINSGSD